MPAATTTAPQPRRFQCRHIFTDGHRCGSPCLRNEEFCFYHHTSRGRAANPASGALPTIDLSQGEHQKSPFTLPSLEDRGAIQLAIGEVLNRLAANQLDARRAGLLLYGLQIASLNLPQPAPARPQPRESPVEEIVSDPTLGPIAPSTEILPPGENDQPTTLSEMLLRELRRHNPIPPPEPHILNELNATAADLTATAADLTAPDDLTATAQTSTPPTTSPPIRSPPPQPAEPFYPASSHASLAGPLCDIPSRPHPPNGVISTEGRPQVSRSGETCGSPAQPSPPTPPQPTPRT